MERRNCLMWLTLCYNVIMILHNVIMIARCVMMILHNIMKLFHNIMKLVIYDTLTLYGSFSLVGAGVDPGFFFI